MAKIKQAEQINLGNVRIVFRNLSGKGGPMNAEGKRNFCVLISKEEAEELEPLGWNVKYLKPREEGDEEQPYLKVNVNYSGYNPPRVVLINLHGQSILDESDVNLIDTADIKNVDMTITPYHYDVNWKTGISAYLKSMYVTIEEDPFEAKYFSGPDVPDSAMNTIEFQAVKKSEEAKRDLEID